MLYFVSYLSLGIFLLVLKSPIRKLVDCEVADLKMTYLVKNEDFHNVKLFLFRLILSMISIVLYPVILHRRSFDVYTGLPQDREWYRGPIESELALLCDEVGIEKIEAENAAQ